MAKAEQFASVAADVRDLADEAADVADAYVTLCVHAGIAAADVLCAARLQVRARGENHHEAVALLATVDESAAKYLKTLLDIKAFAGYGHEPTRLQDTVRAGRAVDVLIRLARAVR